VKTSRLAWAPVAVSSLLWIATGVLFFMKGGSAGRDPVGGGDTLPLLVVIGSAMTVFAAMGGIIAYRTRNVIGWIFCGVALCVSVRAVTDGWVHYGHFAATHEIPGFLAAAWISNWIWVPAMGSLGTFLFLLFPNGHPPSRRWRVIGWLGVAAMVAAVSSVAFAPGPLEDYPYVANPFALPKPFAGVTDVLGVGYPLLLAAILGSIASLVVRARRASAIERAQIKWIAFAGGLFAIGFSASILLADLTYWYVLVFVPIAGIAVASAVAIQRYRLYDIDRIISRTLAYAILTALLGGTFALIVLVPTAAIGATTPGWLVAVATLAAFGLFRPLRRRVQDAVDHRFNRRRYDAEHTIDVFTARLREQVDIDALGDELTDVVQRTMQPNSVSLWLRSETPT
jgi:hypothetical protein